MHRGGFSSRPVYECMALGIKKHELFLVGGQTVSIYDIISKVSRMGSLNLKINQKEREKTFINVKSLKAKKIFNWNREFNL